MKSRFLFKAFPLETEVFAISVGMSVAVILMARQPTPCELHAQNHWSRRSPPWDGLHVLRQRRRVELPQRRHRRRAHARNGVLEPADDRRRVLRQRRRVKLPQRLHRRRAHVLIGVLELADNKSHVASRRLELVRKAGSNLHCTSESSSLPTTVAACCASDASSFPSVDTAARRTYASESSSLPTTAAACCASDAASSCPSVDTAARRTPASESSSLPTTAAACCAGRRVELPQRRHRRTTHARIGVLELADDRRRVLRQRRGRAPSVSTAA